MNQKDAFKADSKDCVKLAAQIIDVGINQRRRAHMKTLQARAERLKREANDQAMAGVH